VRAVKRLPDQESLSPRGALVGRDAELTLLRAGLTAAIEGRGGMFLLVGEPGIGKTRLAEELAILAKQHGAAVFWGRSTLAEGAPPYWPWVEILRALLKEIGAEQFARLAGPGLADVLQVIPQLRASYPDISSPSIGDESASRFQIYDTITQLLVDAATRRPTVLILDDLHWADDPSLLLLEMLAGNVPRAAMMILGAYRDRELAPDHPLRRGLAEFVRRGETQLVPVGGLSEPEIASLLRALTDAHPSPGVVDRLLAQTGGNPFFIAEVARSFTEMGGEIDSSVHTVLRVVPEGVGAVLRRRIDALPAPCRSILEAAAVIGDEFGVELLGSAVEKEPPVLLDLMDEATRVGLLTRRNRRHAFAHGLVRDTVYQSIPTVRRAQLHQRVGSVLEDVQLNKADRPLAQLAYHFSEAAGVEASHRPKAISYAIAAGRRAFAELAYEEAARLIELGLAMDESGRAQPGRASLLLELAEAYCRAGNVGRAIEVATELSTLALRAGDRDMLARAALVLHFGGVTEYGSDPILKLWAAVLAQPPNDTSLRIQVLSFQAVSAMLAGAGAGETAARTSLEAMKLAEASPDPDARFAAIQARQMACTLPSGLEERLALADRVFELAQSSGRESLSQWGHDWRIDAFIELGEVEKAESEIAVALQRAERLREPLAKWRAMMARVALAFLGGRFAEAAALSEDARAVARRGRHAAGELMYLAQWAALRFVLGGIDEAIAVFQPMADKMPPLTARAQTARGLVASGRRDEARLSLNQAMTGGVQNAHIAWMADVAAAAEAAAELGERQHAAVLYRALVPYAARNVASGAGQYVCWGSAARYLGMLATTMEQWDAAQRHFEAALVMNRRMGAIPFIAYTQVAYAEMLVRRAQAGDSRRAIGLIEPALATARKLGMKPLEERAVQLLDGVRHSAAAKSPLSTREREIAARVAEGLSNKAIAERLHLSERTVESHVKNICDKLGFNSRWQVADWVTSMKLPSKSEG